MASDTSLIFNLIARDKASAAIEKAKERISTTAATIGAGAAAALGTGLLANLDMEAAGDKLAAQLGVGPEKAAELSKISANVFKNAWGESIGEVSDAVGRVYRDIGDPGPAEGGIEALTTKALALAETFDIEVSAATSAVGQMIKTGLVDNATEGFDLVTVALRKLGTTGEDFLETLGEYSVQFAKVGLDGPKALGLVNQMLQAGAKDSDVAADAIKEFALEVGQGSDKAREGLEGLGLDADRIFAMFGAGGATADKAFSMVLDSLKRVENPIKRNALATALFGTKAEDLADALFAMDPSRAVASLGQIKGAMDDVKETISDNPAKALEEFKRRALLQLGEIGGAMAKWAMENEDKTRALAISLGVIAGLIMAIKAGMILWTAAQAAWTGMQAVATAAQWAWNAALAANPITWVIVGIVALVAAIVVLWKKNEGFRNFIKGAWAAILGAFKAVWDWVKVTWPKITGVFTRPISAAVDGISGSWRRLRQGASDAVQAVFGQGRRLVDWARELPGRLLRAVGDVAGSMASIGRNVVVGIWNGLAAAGRWLHDQLWAWIRRVVPEPIRRFLNISSPSRLMAGIGVNIAEGLAVGITRGAPLVDRSARDLAARAVPPLATLPYQIERRPDFRERGGVPPAPPRATPRLGRIEILMRIDSNDQYLLRALRKSIRVVSAGSNVQLAFGRH